MLLVIYSADRVLSWFKERAVGIIIPLDYDKCTGLLPRDDPALVLACAQFIKAGWSYGVTWICLVSIALATLAMSAIFIKKMCKNILTIRIVFLMWFLFIVALCIILRDPSKLYSLTGSTVDNKGVQSGLFKTVFSVSRMIDTLDFSILVGNFICILAGVTMAAACFSTILDLPGATNLNNEDQKELVKPLLSEMSIRFFRLRVLIAMGAALLVFGVFTISGYLTWPASFMKENERKIYTSLVEGVLLVEGTEYFLFLLSVFFLPAGIIFMNARGLAIKSGASSQEDINVRLKEVGLNFSFPSVLKDGLTVMAPLVASALAATAKLIP